MSSNPLDLRRDDRSPDYLESAREIAPMLAAAGDEIEERRELPERVVETLIERGFFRMLLPRSLGGAELDPLTYVQVLEEIAKADPSTAWCLGQNSGCSMTAPYLDPAVADEIFGPPRGILAWGPELPGAGRGVAVEGGIRVTGRWALLPAAGTPPGSARTFRSSSRTVRRALTPTAARLSAPCCFPRQAPRSSTTGRSSDCVAPAATATGWTTCLCRRNTPLRVTTRPSGASLGYSTGLPAA